MILFKKLKKKFIWKLIWRSKIKQYSKKSEKIEKKPGIKVQVLLKMIVHSFNIIQFHQPVGNVEWLWFDILTKC